MENFIFESAIDVNLCDKLLEYFKKSKNKYEGSIFSTNLNKMVVDKDHKDSIDSYIPFESDICKEYVDELQKVVNQYIEKYPYCNEFAPWGLVQEVNLQHYKPGGAYKKYHCERGSSVGPSATRHLVFMTYLNDLDDGGETEFLYQKLKVKPVKGKTVIFPADWTHTHRGIPSFKQDKYIATGWFNYYENVIQ